MAGFPGLPDQAEIGMPVSFQHLDLAITGLYPNLNAPLFGVEVINGFRTADLDLANGRTQWFVLVEGSRLPHQEHSLPQLQPLDELAVRTPVDQQRAFPLSGSDDHPDEPVGELRSKIGIG